MEGNKEEKNNNPEVENNKQEETLETLQTTETETPKEVQEEPKEVTVNAQVIGELETEKQKGVFGLIIFFVILIGVTVGLPYIKEYLDNRNAPVEEQTKQEEQKNPTDENETEQEIVYYEIDANTEFSFENLKITALSKEQSDDTYLNLTVENTGNDTINVNDGYFMELFNGEKTLLERVKIINSKTISSNEKVNLKLQISSNSYTNATLLTINKKTTDDYPEISLTVTEDDFNVLTCTNLTRNISYYFKEDKLQKITDIYEYTNADVSAYTSKLKEYTTLASNYNNIDGVSSNIVDTTNSFTMNTQIDLSKAKVKNLDSSYYYDKDTTSKQVKFEMEAMRYTCK